jgi:DNA-binding protein Fis
MKRARELRNVIERTTVLANVEEAHIKLTLRPVRNNVGKAGALLGISPRPVRKRIAAFQKMHSAQTRADQPRLTEFGATGAGSAAAAKGAGA